ncbi:MAG: CRISPR-associated endonuclease Cas2 [Christensenella sp.]
MLVVITYDVCTGTPAGKTRLRKVSKVCQNYGQRVQNSVFECCVDYNSFLKLKKQLEGLIDTAADSLRFYNLGNKWESKIEHIGAKAGYNPQDLLLL